MKDRGKSKWTSNNAPTNRETLGTAIVGMTNGSYRYRHFDNLSGDAVTAELFGVRRLRPRLVRGDVGLFGNEVVILCCETNRTRYLFKVKRTKNIREIFQLHLANGTDWEDAGEQIS